MSLPAIFPCTGAKTVSIHLKHGTLMNHRHPGGLWFVERFGGDGIYPDATRCDHLEAHTSLGSWVGLVRKYLLEAPQLVV